MATRRKYKSPPAYRDGGRVPTSDIPIAPDGAEMAAPPPLPAAPALPADEENPLQKALEAQARAEQLQRQHLAAQQPPTVDDYIRNLPVTDRKKNFLRANPALVTRPDIAAAAVRHYQAALQAGLGDDTDEIERYILDNVAREIEHHAELTSAAARPTAENQALHQAAADLQREAEDVRAELAPAPAPPPAPPAPLRRTMPMTAPVSREVPTMSGRRQPEGWNTLSAEEVSVAHNSFSDPTMSNAQKEYLYLQNKRKYLRMKADGSYSDQGGG